MWRVEVTREFREWFSALDDSAGDAVGSAIDVLIDRGPALGRPRVDRIKGSAWHHMKELRVSAGRRKLRVLFAFDPRGVAMLLLGGDKSGMWTDWYVAAIPVADAIYERHLEHLRREDER